MCEQVLCSLDSSQSVCAVPDMTNSFPKPPESLKSPPQSPGGVCAQSKAGTGVGERSICAVFRGSKPHLHIFPSPAFPRELQSPPGASRLAVVGRRIPWKANTEQQSTPCEPCLGETHAQTCLVCHSRSELHDCEMRTHENISLWWKWSFHYGAVLNHYINGGFSRFFPWG